MATATIFNKVLTGGDSKGVVLEPGSELLRETNFPANWLKIRIGIIGSWTNLVDNNGTPTAETVVGVAANPLTSLSIGMSNGVSFLGQVGNRFVGKCSDRDTRSIGMNTSASNWGAGTSTFQLAMSSNVGDGSTVNVSSPDFPANATLVNDPTASSSCLFANVLEMDLSLVGAGVMTPRFFTSALSPLSNATDVTLNGLLNTSTFTAQNTGTGGWWNQTGSTPIDCRFLSIRAPFTLNRMVIHNIMLQQYL